MVFERLAKPWGEILSGFDSQSLRHLMEACDNWLVGLSRIQVRGNPLGVRVAPLPPSWGVGPVVYAAGLSIRYFTGSNPVHPAIFSGVLSVAATRQNVTLQFRVQLSEDPPTSE